MTNGFCYLNSLDMPFPVNGVSGWFLLQPCFREIYVFNTNRADPDQTPRFAASDLGIHCLPLSFLWDARYNWVKDKMYCNQIGLVVIKVLNLRRHVQNIVFTSKKHNHGRRLISLL